MKQNGILIAWILAGVSAGFAVADAEEPDEFELFREQAAREYEKFRQSATNEYEDFRKEANKEYADFLAQPWTPIKLSKPNELPHEREIRPTPTPVKPQKETLPQRTIGIDTIYAAPRKQDQPQPLAPVIKHEENRAVRKLSVQFFGTPVTVSGFSIAGWHLGGTTEKDIAAAWQRLSDGNLDNMLADCLSARKNLALPDWGYFQMVDAIAAKAVTPNSNEHALLMGFLLHQSGYKIRYGIDTSRKLIMLFASDGCLFGRPQYYDAGDMFYTYQKPSGTQISICKTAYPKEKRMSMGLTEVPRFAYSPGERRTVTAHGDSRIKATVTPNKNLTDFYAQYPDAALDQRGHSKWLIHAETPVSEEVRKGLYPMLKAAIAGKGNYEAVSILLDFCQSFPYGYDSEIWGRDRAFWPDESWQYPLSDCEDHAIQFTRLVRDLTGLETALIYYPGHLAAAVAFPEGKVGGDYLTYKGKHYTICDPTYFYARIGQTMPECAGAKAILIELKP